MRTDTSPRGKAYGQSPSVSVRFLAGIILGHCYIWLPSSKQSAPEPSNKKTGGRPDNKKPFLSAIVEREGFESEACILVLVLSGSF